jgi:nucleotide-binding universal stress UspA family protein
MFKRILVPVDLTKKSLAAVEMAHELAQQFQSGVTLLHVIETIEHVKFDEMKEFYDRLEKSAQEGLRLFSERFTASGLEVRREVTYGHRSKDIVQFAIKSGSDLVIMASHRIDPDRPGHDWSSISYAVAIMAPCPVLLAK